MKILYVAYPLLPLSQEIAGGAEQVLLTLAGEVASRGHEVTVAAAAGSSVPGRLLATGQPSIRNDDFERRKSEHEHAVLEHLSKYDYDLVHDMSGSFWQLASAITAPLLATLHLPPEFYPPQAFWQAPGDVVFNGVSHAQARHFAHRLGIQGLEVVSNGILIEQFPFCEVKQNYLLWLGRICEEKAPHLACEVAVQMGIPLVLAGQVYPFSYHQEYFFRQLRPWLSSNKIEFIGSMPHARKLQLLSNARALLITSCADETSSMVAMEAMACGTPVIAFRRGALAEVVRDSVTGFIADNIEGMRESVAHVDSIVPLACREHVVRRFSATQMANDYLRLYGELAADRASNAAEIVGDILPQTA